jgi:hypothetical protein
MSKEIQNTQSNIGTGCKRAPAGAGMFRINESAKINGTGNSQTV